MIYAIRRLLRFASSWMQCVNWFLCLMNFLFIHWGP